MAFWHPIWHPLDPVLCCSYLCHIAHLSRTSDTSNQQPEDHAPLSIRPLECLCTWTTQRLFPVGRSLHDRNDVPAKPELLINMKPIRLLGTLITRTDSNPPVFRNTGRGKPLVHTYIPSGLSSVESIPHSM